MIGDGDEEEWRPSCYDCGREVSRRNLQPTEIHIQHDEGMGYDVVDVPLCPGCQKERLPTYECQTCGEEYIYLDRAAECCQHRHGPIMPDGGPIRSETPRVDVRVPAAQRQQLDDLVDAGRYPTRSEAIRSAIRRELRVQTGGEDPVADQLQAIYEWVRQGRRAEAVGAIDQLAETLAVEIERPDP